MVELYLTPIITRKEKMIQSQYSNDVFSVREKKKNEIKKCGTVAGSCVIGYLLIQEVISFILIASGLYDLYLADTLFQQCFGLVTTIIALIVPHIIGGKYLSKTTEYDIIPAGKADSTWLAVLAVPAGTALCLASSYLSSIFTIITDLFGIELSMPDLSVPSGGYELLIYALRLTVCAAVIEEICFRGVIMQPLRKYGNFFAIAMSAVMFGLIHCNLIQAPFAILAGVIIGYFTVCTESIWTGIAIHAMNNTVSAVSSYILTVLPNEQGEKMASLLISGVFAIGIGCCLILWMFRDKLQKNLKKESNPNSLYDITTGQKLKAFFGNIPMILAIIAICCYTAQYVDL